MKKLNQTLLRKNIEETQNYDFENKKVFGSAYYVSQEGEFELEVVRGVMSLQGNEPVSRNTLFRLASMTKPVTAFAALLLEDRKLLSISDPVEKYLPEFGKIKIITDDREIVGAPEKTPTILNILTHSSGIGTSLKKNAWLTREEKSDRDKFLQAMLEHGLDFEPGTKQQYSGIGAFNVLSKIIEIVSGKNLEEFFRTEIFESCGMTDTCFDPSEELIKRIIVLHDRKENENAEFFNPDGCIFGDYPTTHYLGGGGLLSTLSDYAKFAKMLLHGGCINGKRLLDENTFKKMRTPQVSKDIMPGAQRWGLGVRVITEREYPYLPVNTFGWSGAYGSHFWVDPDNGITAVYMKNSRFDGGAGNESARNFEKAVYTAI